MGDIFRLNHGNIRDSEIVFVRQKTINKQTEVEIQAPLVKTLKDIIKRWGQRGISKDVYKDLFKTEPEVKAIHAGLECGLFLQKYPDLDMISFGPTIKGAHTPEERIEIETVGKFWKFLLELLEKTPDEK